MGELFRNVLNASFQGGVVIAVVLLMRLTLKKAPKKYVCLLWVLVGVRLLCPVTLESPLSLQPQDQVVTQAEWEQLQALGTITLDRGEEAPLVPEEPVHIREYMQPVDAEATQPRRICWAEMIPYIWVAGAGILAAYSIASYGLLRRRVREAVKLTEGVWECDRIDTAFILGYLRPQIYIPAGMPVESRRFILDHEDTHLRRGDHWVKLIGFAALAVHWFNPLVWVAYILMCKDIEMACDEAVVKNMALEDRKAYSAALLMCSTDHRSVAACPVAFGEVPVKQRILSVLNYRKKSFWFSLIAVAAVIFVAVCFLTSPAEKIDPLTLEDWGITMKAMDPTSNGVTVAIDIPENLDGNIVINYGAWVLQVYSDGEWEDVPMLSQEDDYPWNGHVATVFPDNNAHYAKLDWSAVYGEIGPGRYRVCETLELMQDGLGWNKDFYGEFQITGTEASDAPEWGITLETDNVTSKGLTLFITQSGQLVHQELFYGQDYFLERWNENTWEAVEPIIENGAFTTEAILLPQNQTTRLDINWKWLYGELPAGTYRIGKSIGNDVTAPIGVNLPKDNLPQEQGYTYFAEFTVPGVRSASEEEVLAYCRSALEGWQSFESCAMICVNEFNIDAVLNNHSVQRVWMDGGNWYGITDMEEALTTDYTLFRDGKQYERAENGHYPEAESVWEEVTSDHAEEYLPWLCSYVWNEDRICVDSSEIVDGSVRISLRVEEEIKEAGLTVPYYYLVFEFSGRDVLTSVSLGLNSAGESVCMTVQLVSTDREEIAGVIDGVWKQIQP